ncbi:MAG: serine/threonine-protein kinase [Verrucomicrobiota bacterium]|nr:serine/threonine-protein kinase [Verrucomicrobiota bacterium]
MIGFGRYNLLLKLGQGGMGAVYLARQKALKRFCAIKLISESIASDEEVRARFLREARATASLSHSNLVSVFDCDTYKGQTFIAMEFVEGLTLGEILKQGKVPLPLALYFLHQAVTGLDYIHTNGIIHRDIKPDNLIVNQRGGLKIMDLGLATNKVENDVTLTAAGTMMGSPHYMSPEQINDSKDTDQRADLYSIGVTFYQLLTGTVPYPRTSATAILVAHLNEPFPSVSLDDAELTQRLDTFLDTMTAKDRDVRRSSAGELLTDIHGWLTEFPMDDASNDCFGHLGFQERSVESLLLKEGVKKEEIDANLVEDDTSLTRPKTPIKQTPLTPTAPQTIPANVFSTIAFREPEPDTNYKIWGYLFAIIILSGVGFYLYKTVYKWNPPPTNVSEEFKNPEPPTFQEEQSIPSQPQPEPETAGTGAIGIKTNPPDATVEISDQTKQSPAQFLNIPLGTHKLKISKEGFDTIVEDIAIEQGHKNSTFLLSKISSSVNILTNPQGAVISYQGETQGESPAVVKGRPGDRRVYQIKKDGFNDMEVTLTFGSDDNTINVPLTPLAMGDPAGRNSRSPASLPAAQPTPAIRKKAPQEIINLNLTSLSSANCTVKADEILTTIQGLPKDQWDAGSGYVFQTLKNRMVEENVDQSGDISKAISDLNSIFIQARSHSPEDFLSQKQEMTNRLKRALNKGFGVPQS